RPVGRLWRRARRNPVASLALLAALLTLVAAGVAAYQAHFAYRAANLRRQIDRLDRPEATAEYLQQAEPLPAKLGRLRPDEAATLRRRLYRAFDLAIAELYSDRLTPEVVPRVEAALALLHERDPGLWANRDQEFRSRLAIRQLVADLSTGRDSHEDVFGPGRCRADGGTIVRAIAGDRPADAAVLTLLPCDVDVELRAVFDHPSWEDAGELGLLLNAGPGGGYTFLLRFVGDSPSEKSFAAARRGKGLAELCLYRGKRLLRQRPVALEQLLGRPLELAALREGDRLKFLVHGQPLLSFH